jgi:hypothetical protein
VAVGLLIVAPFPRQHWPVWPAIGIGFAALLGAVARAGLPWRRHAAVQLVLVALLLAAINAASRSPDWWVVYPAVPLLILAFAIDPFFPAGLAGLWRGFRTGR